MPSCWGHLSWEGLWHKPKQMLIAEPYEALLGCLVSRALLALTSLAWGLPPHPAHGPRAPFQLSPGHPALPWAMLEVSLCPTGPDLLLGHPGLTSHLACGLAYAWWSLDCHLDLALLTNTKKPVSPSHCSPGDLVNMTNTSEHFMFQGHTLILVSLSGLTSKVPKN